MSFFFRRRITESSYEIMVRYLTSGGVLLPHHRVSYDMFCSFVYQYSSKEIPDIFYKELDERLSREIEDTAERSPGGANQLD